MVRMTLWSYTTLTDSAGRSPTEILGRVTFRPLTASTSVGRVSDGHDFERLFREAGPGMFRAVYAFTGGRRQVAEEAVAEAFARALEHERGIRDPVRWMYRTAFRIAAAELRRERNEDSEPPERDAPAEPAGLGELMEALRELSPNQRAAVVLRYEADLPVAEIARRMGMSAPTVRVHLHRGRKRLRELLGADEVESEQEPTDA
jgi:RNA polymerase sigma-70 factor (ECF subfamily)